MRASACLALGLGVFFTGVPSPPRARAEETPVRGHTPSARARGPSPRMVPPLAAASRGPLAYVVIYGHTEEISHVGFLPSDVREALREKLHHGAAIGFAYKRFHIFWLDLWRWNGRHVLYDGDTYWEVSTEEWGELLGQAESGKLRKPFFYHFPPGVIVVVSLVTLACLYSWLYPSDAVRVRRLLKDARYREASRIYTIAASPPEGPAAEQADEAALAGAALRRAAKHLQDMGVPPDQAERNMSLIAKTLRAETKSEAKPKGQANAEAKVEIDEPGEKK